MAGGGVVAPKEHGRGASEAVSTTVEPSEQRPAHKKLRLAAGNKDGGQQKHKVCHCLVWYSDKSYVVPRIQGECLVTKGMFIGAGQWYHCGLWRAATTAQHSGSTLGSQAKSGRWARSGCHEVQPAFGSGSSIRRCCR